jgi:Phage tail sheath protein.
MALGGGTFTTQNKVLPGSYVNIISASRASATISDRGYAAVPLVLDWGNDTDIITVTAEDFYSKSLKIFGHPYTADTLKPLRDLFLGARTAYLYRVNGGGVKAANTYATALYSGLRGNDLKIIIADNAASTVQNPIYDVSTVIDTTVVDTQTVTGAAQLKNNAWVEFKSAPLAITAGVPLTGGTNGTISNAKYQEFLDKIESYSFNTLGCPSDDVTLKALFVNFTIRMRETVGLRFQCVVHKHEAADHESIISVDNNATPELIYWVTGASAGCAINASLTNKIYTGEYDINTNYTQTDLETNIRNGLFTFHRVSDTIRVLDDINTFTSFAENKGSIFANNQTVRITDQIANDIAVLFNDKYLGAIPNDESGRVSLWSDIVSYNRALERIRAIEDFQPDTLKVEQGETKESVVVSNYITIINAMTRLYMTVIVA